MISKLAKMYYAKMVAQWQCAYNLHVLSSNLPNVHIHCNSRVNYYFCKFPKNVVTKMPLFLHVSICLAALQNKANCSFMLLKKNNGIEKDPFTYQGQKKKSFFKAHLSWLDDIYLHPQTLRQSYLTIFLEGCQRFLRQVIRHDRVAFLQKVSGHVIAHVAQTDEADSWLGSLLRVGKSQ